MHTLEDHTASNQLRINLLTSFHLGIRHFAQRSILSAIRVITREYQTFISKAYLSMLVGYLTKLCRLFTLELESSGGPNRLKLKLNSMGVTWAG